jgi:hypothetical protein
MERHCLFGKFWFGCLLFFLFFSGCVFGNREAKIPDSQLPAITNSLEPGLLVYFRYGFYRHINQMAGNDIMVSEGIQGTPVLSLNHQFTGEIFDSGKEKGVGVLLSGYLKMETPGIYRFQAMSNDGIQVNVNQERVVFDPPVHSDRISETGEVTVSNPRWYPISVKYYQRKGSARLELYWQPPEAKGFVIIPANAYGHIKAVQ